MCNDHDNSLRFALAGEFIPFRRTFSVVVVIAGVLFLFFSLYHNNNLS